MHITYKYNSMQSINTGRADRGLDSMVACGLSLSAIIFAKPDPPNVPPIESSRNQTMKKIISNKGTQELIKPLILRRLTFQATDHTPRDVGCGSAGAAGRKTSGWPDGSAVLAAN